MCHLPIIQYQWPINARHSTTYTRLAVDARQLSVWCVLAFRFLTVFMCLLLSVFSTIEQYEEVAGITVYYLVSNAKSSYLADKIHQLYNVELCRHLAVPRHRFVVCCAHLISARN